MKALYRSASILKNRRVVFNIKGNDYRLTMLHFTLQPCNVIYNISGFI
ncbi:type II toxin-antitoxin system HigB family toxin [Citrobacter koseri]|nr:type II toxin-antitoxin system HigB family toxin [Citrobacter koseri]